MASTTLANGLEVPAVAGCGPKSNNVPSSSSAAVYSSHPRSVDIPLFDEDNYEEWVMPRIVASLMANYESNMGKVTKKMWRDLLMATFEIQAQKMLYSDPEKFIWIWEPVKKKKSVSFFQDVPYKHSEKTGEIFEGPISSHTTYENETGEHLPVFVNPELSA